jgi:hypothetical protein
MAFVVNDRVQEFTSTTGTGTLTLTGSPDGFETFSSAVGNGNTTYYTISSNTTEFEVGIGTVGAGTLSRDTVISSSNSDALVNFSAGTKNVFVTLPASKTILLNDSDTVDLTGNLDLNSNDITGTGNINITGNLTASGNLTSLGIDDNATSTAITIDSSQNVNIGGDLSSESIELGGAPNAFGTNISNAYIFKTGATGSAPFNQAGALLYQPRTTTTEGRSNHLFYTGSPLALRQNIHPNGDISFYEDTGTTAKLFWDSSTERLGIGTASPVGKLHIQSSASDQIYLNGTSGDAFGLWVSDTGTNFNLGTWGVGERIIIDNSGNTLQFQTDNSERMRIDSSGNVGIGTNSPLDNLQVTGSGNRYIGVSCTSSGAAVLELLSSGSSEAICYSNNLRFATITGLNAAGFTERMRIDSSGNVGIGTSSPSASYGKLTVAGGMTIADDNNAKLQIGRYSAGVANSYIKMGANSNSLRFTNPADSADLMTINSTGNVGIGTSSPAHNVEIVATASGSINDSLQIRNNATATGTGSRIRFINSTDANSDANGASLGTVRSGDDNAMFFETENAERMRINHLGNVGIGTTAPDAKLSVNGVASFGDGTALLPSIANFGDLNTGMWFPAADTIAFSEGGVEAMRIDSSGRVGIGTASPDALLTVDGIASFGAGAAATPSIAASGDLNTGMFFPAADVIGFSTGGGQRMRINSDGNVGIGTSSPLYKLDVPSVSGARFSKSNVFLGKEVTIINSPGQTKTIEIATAGDAGAYFKVIITGIYVPGSNLWSTYEYEKVYVNSLAVGGNSAIYTVFNQSVGSFQFQAGDFVISRPGSGVVRIVYTENASNNGNIYLNVNVIGLGGYGVPSAITIT